MSELWENIVSGEELNKARRERKKDFIADKFHADTRLSMEKDGWEYVSTYSNNTEIKMEKAKPLGERFENKVWLMLNMMGYSEMNRDSSFVVAYDKKFSNLTKQIDVFAADEETVLVVECKSSEKPSTKKDFQMDIDGLKGIREGLINSIKQRYPNRQIKFVWATSNILLGQQDKDRLTSADIALFDDDAIEYYSGLAHHLGFAAKYQLLGQLFKNKKISGMPQTVAAIKGEMGGHTYYSFSIEPERLLKIGYVLHRSDANRNMMPTYQRIVKRARLKAVQEFVAGGGYFPNSVIISFDSSKKKPLRFDIKASDADTNTKIGTLYLPQQYSSAYIIDGQHRLYGYSDSEYAKTNTIPVVAFEDLDQKEQIRLFMEINENQKAVPKNLRNTLNADMLWLDDSYNERRKALRLKIAQELGEDRHSPLYDRVLIGENSSSDLRCITMESIDKGLRASNFFTIFNSDNSVEREGSFDNGSGSNEYSFDLIFPFLILSFEYFQKKLPEEWDQGKGSQGILSMNTGIYALVRIFNDTIDCLVEKNIIFPKKDSPEKILSFCTPFYDAVINFYKNIDENLRQEIKTQYGDNGARQHWRYFQKAIHDEMPDDFNPEGLSDWWADNSKEYNEISEDFLNEISNLVRTRTAQELESLKGAKWRSSGIPLSIKSAYAKKVVTENDKRDSTGDTQVDTWDFVTMKDCAEIATSGSNWSDGFKDLFTQPDKAGKRINKQNATKWLEDMDKLLQKLKRSGVSISRSEFEYIRSVHEWLSSRDIRDKI